jgi:hypothetical protein
MIRYPSYSPDLAAADFFLFPRMKSKLAGLSLTQESFQKNSEGVVQTILQDECKKSVSGSAATMLKNN